MTLTFEELWSRLNAGDESVLVEVKQATRIDKSVLQTVSAFANTPGRDGGYLLLGVRESEDDLFAESSYEVVGVTDPGKLQEDLATQCRDALIPPVRPLMDPAVVGGRVVLVVRVPESAPQDKPVYLKGEGLPRGAYLRVGGTDQHCTQDDLEVLFQSRGTTTFDEAVVDDTTPKDVDPAALEEYRRARRDVNASAGELRMNNADLLHALHATREVKGQTRLTVAGLMLFGREAALRRYSPMARVDYLRVEGREWVPDPEKRYNAVEMRGPLMTLVPRVIQQVLSDIPSAFSLAPGGIHRRDVPLVPRTVIREAVVNALMHRTYRVRSPVQIIRYANRVEIRNPGHSLKPEDRLGDPGSISRNEKIAAVLHEAGLAETKGTGIRAMRDEMTRANLTLPLFESDRESDTFTVRLLVHHFLGPEDVAWLSRFKDCELGNEDARALLAIRELGAIDNAAYRDLNRVDTLTASRGLRRLRELELVEKKGKANAPYYSPTGRLAEAIMDFEAGRAGSRQISEEGGMGGEPAQSEAQPAPSRGQSAQSDAQPAQSAPQTAQTSPEPASTWQIMTPRRSDPDQLREAILHHCRETPRTAQELANLLGRNHRYLRANYLKPMVEDGSLQRVRAPRTSRSQAYRASGTP